MKLVGVSGYVHTVEDSSCACMKIIPGRASVHSVNQSINQSINNQSIYVYTWDGVAPIIRAGGSCMYVCSHIRNLISARYCNGGKLRRGDL